MSNIITLNKNTPVSEYLQMSNGATSAFINLFALSGSKLAEAEQEKRLIVWVLEKNQSVVGTGTVSFEICDMPWDFEKFEESKKFLGSVLRGMRNKIGWETLGYIPNEDILYPFIDAFEKLLLKMTPDDINIEEVNAWIEESSHNDPILNGFPKCPIHDVLLSVHGCQLCTD